MNRQQRRAAAVFCAAAAAAACRRPAPDGGETPVAYTAVERARTDSSANLTWAHAVDVDRRGNVYVGDQWAVKVFAPDGTLLRTVGRRGSGPGEFQGIASVAVIPGDSLFVFDGGSWRVTVLEPGTGRAAYTVQVGREQLRSPARVARVRGGRALLAVFESAYNFNDPIPEGVRGGSDLVRLLNADGSLLRDSVLLLRERENLVYRDPVAVGPNPFGRESWLAVTARDRLVTAWGDSLKFEVYAVDGRHLKTIRPAWAPPRRPLTAAERESVAVTTADAVVPAPAIRRALDRYRATTWPLLRELVVDDRDRIWAGINGGPGEPVRWTAFDQRGARVAEVDLPANALLRVVRGTTAWATVFDHDDVPAVVTYDLRPAGRVAAGKRGGPSSPRTSPGAARDARAGG
ncbi:MAG TPA: hypothetical protein VFJ82_24405 [Longimicrobium sp.]|nr:hypothetical protein [Longimicrobium sp.]